MRIMPTLPQLVPDADVLVALPPEELAMSVLVAANSGSQNGMFSRMSVSGPELLYGNGIPGPTVYPRERSAQIEEAVGEAWLWLELNMISCRQRA